MCQATVLPRSIARCPSASTRWLLPVPLGPQTQSASARPIHSSVRSACWVGLRDRRGVLVPGVERLAGRQPGRAAAHRDRRLVAAGGLLGEQDAQDLGGLPALGGGGRDHLRRRAPDVGHPQPPQQAVELVGDRRRRQGVLTVIAPKPSQERVERCSDCCSLARAGNSITRRAAVREDRRQVALAEAAGGRRGGERLVDVARAVQLGERDGLGDLAPQPGRAGRGGGESATRSAPGPIARNACSSSVPRSRAALERARRPRRVVLVADARPPRRRQLRGGRPRAARRARRRARHELVAVRRVPRRARRPASTGPSRARRRPRSSTARTPCASGRSRPCAASAATGAAAPAPRPASPPARAA